jgi:hypothetical protein
LGPLRSDYAEQVPFQNSPQIICEVN